MDLSYLIIGRLNLRSIPPAAAVDQVPSFLVWIYLEERDNKSASCLRTGTWLEGNYKSWIPGQCGAVQCEKKRSVHYLMAS